MMKFFKKNKKGFSLVELIVVIAILGILAVIAVPRVMENLETARVNADNANLRMVRGAVAMFQARHGRFPGTHQGGALLGTVFGNGATNANYNLLATNVASHDGIVHNLRDFLDLNPPVMPVPRSGWEFRYDPINGVVILFDLP